MFVYNIFLLPFTLDCDLLVYSEDIIHKVYIVTYFSPMKKKESRCLTEFPQKMVAFSRICEPCVANVYFFIVYIYDLF